MCSRPVRTCAERDEPEEGDRDAAAPPESLVSEHGAPRATPGTAQFRALLAGLPELVLVRDGAGVLTYCSPAVERYLGYRADDVEGTREREWIHPSDLEMRNTSIDRLVATGEPQQPLEIRLRHGDGTWRWFETTDADCLGDPDIRGIVTATRDVTNRVAARDELVSVSLHDSLTGLPNRLLVMDRLEVALARTARSDTTLGLLFCDLDDFKIINDSLGHEVGDQVLIEVAHRIKRVLRNSDTVARTGGDEFVVVSDGLRDLDEATDLAERIRDVIEAPLEFHGVQAVLSVSIGIVAVQGPAAAVADPMSMMRNADAAMYRAKRGGKARWDVFDDQLIEEATHRLELEPALRHALDREQLLVYYQPIFDVSDGSIVGVEALLRWDHPTHGLLLPDDFIPLAEETGVIVAVGAWALDEACRQAIAWSEQYKWRGWVSVNLSVRQVAQPGLAEAIRERLSALSLDPDRLWLELTESALLRAGHSAEVELVAVQASGVHIGMDDFGTGYASLSNLQRLPIDFLKIDQSFVAALKGGPEQEKSNALVAAITSLGQALDLQTVAEGVETDEQSAILQGLGCRYAQGYLFCRPAPAADLAELFAMGGSR